MNRGEKSEVHNLSESIRELVCQQRVRQGLETSHGRWSQIVACLDALEDSELAIASYFDADDTDKGALYLATYGVFQAFIIQQDAAQVLARCLGIKNIRRKQYKDLGRIRGLRNKVSGHPASTKAGHRGLERTLQEIGVERQEIDGIMTLAHAHQPSIPEEFHAICRVRLSVGQVRLLTSSEGRKDQHQTIDVRDLVELQQKGMAKMLTSVITRFRKRDAANLEKFVGVHFKDMVTVVYEALDTARRRVPCRDVAPDWDSLRGLAEALIRTPTTMQAELARRGRRLDDIPIVSGGLVEEARGIEQVMADAHLPLPKALHDAFLEYAEWAATELTDLAEEIDCEYQVYTAPNPAAQTEPAEGKNRQANPSKGQGEPFPGARVRLLAQLQGIGRSSIPDGLLLPECSGIAADIRRQCRPWTRSGGFAGSSTTPWKGLHDRMVAFDQKMKTRGLASERYSTALVQALDALDALETLASAPHGHQAAPAFGAYLRSRATALEEEVAVLEEKAYFAAD